MNYLTQALWCIVTIISSSYLHELGHYIVAKKHDKRAKMVKGKGTFEVHFSPFLSKNIQLEIFRAGIWLGFLPILLCFTYVSDFFGIGYGIAYFWIGCRFDREQIRKIRGKE